MDTHAEWETIHSAREWGKWPRTELNQFLTTLGAKQKFAGSKVLDLGCGNGANLWLMGWLQMECVGIDISESAITKTKAWLDRMEISATLAVADMRNIPFEDNTFDVVTDVCSIQCMPTDDVAKVFKEAHRVLKPGGYVFTMFRSSSSWLEPNLPYVNRLSRPELTNAMSPFTIEATEVTEQTLFNLSVSIQHHLIVGRK